MLTLLALLSVLPANAAHPCSRYGCDDDITPPPPVESKLDHNKRIVREFYDLAFNQHRPTDAAMKYLAVSYKQHNPHVADGRQGFIDAFANPTEPDESVTDFKRFVAEDDLVVVHSHGVDHPKDPKDLGVAVVDIFRVSEDLITEHWDVGQKVPATSKNPNGMF
jgi:predicted SnoaL-like aldol condensation-catalyzing enzyme